MALVKEINDKYGLTHPNAYINIVNCNFVKMNGNISLHVLVAIYANEQAYIDGKQPLDSMQIDIANSSDLDTYIKELYIFIKKDASLVGSVDI